MNDDIIPTRLNIHKDLLVECARYNIFLDDKQVFDCEVADSLAGYIIQQRRHPLFKTVMADRNGKIVTRLVKGVVRIERK